MSEVSPLLQQLINHLLPLLVSDPLECLLHQVIPNVRDHMQLSEYQLVHVLLSLCFKQCLLGFERLGPHNLMTPTSYNLLQEWIWQLKYVVANFLLQCDDSSKSIKNSLEPIKYYNMVVSSEVSIVNSILLEYVDVLLQKVLEKYKRRNLVVVSLHLFLVGI